MHQDGGQKKHLSEAKKAYNLTQALNKWVFCDAY